MSILIRSFHRVYSFIRLVSLPIEILLGILRNYYAIRYTKAGGEAASQLQRSADRDARFERWVGEEYPNFP